MATRAIRPKREDGPGRGWPSLPERAPSIIRQDAPGTGRVIALVSLLLVAMGALGMLAPGWGLRYIIGPAWGFFWFALGLGGLLFHAFNEKDQQFRRTYAVLAFILFAAGVVLRVLPYEDVFGGRFLSYGVPCLLLALVFFGSVARNEPDQDMRQRIQVVVGVAGAIMAVAGFFFSTVNANFLSGEGVVLILMGLFYVLGHIGMYPRGDERAYWAAVGLGLIGLLGFLVALFRSMAPLFVTNLDSYIIPSGLLLMGLGLLYLAISLGLCSDLKIIVLTKRELATFFYSPMAYLLIIGMTLVGWFQFLQFVNLVRDNSLIGGGMPDQRGLPEPIVMFMFLDFVPVIALIFLPPLITMRLLSEEQRSGTLEVLLTAPVNEASVVLSKFLAALVFFFVSLLPWALFLVAFRVMGQEPFDYRPLLSFFVALLATGAGFLAAGLFFSSITRNQMIAGVLSFALLLLLTGVFFLKRAINIPSPFNEILTYSSHLDLWISALEGQFAPRLLMFHVSMAVFFLFVTTKVLESRRWK